MKHWEIMKPMYLCAPDERAESGGITGEGALVTAFRVSHSPAVLAAEIQLAKFCSSSTWCTELRLDNLGEAKMEFIQVNKLIMHQEAELWFQDLFILF